MRAKSVAPARSPAAQSSCILMSRIEIGVDFSVFAMQFDKRKGGAAPVAHTPPSSPITYAFLGWLGKGNVPASRLFFMLAFAGGLAGCDLPGRVSRHLGSGEVLAVYGLEGRWAGPVAAVNSSCGNPTTGLMSVGSGTFAFDPFQGTTIIKGTVNEDAFDGTLIRPGGNKQSLSIRFTGQAHRDPGGLDSIEGALVSGRCRWSVSLRRA